MAGAPFGNKNGSKGKRWQEAIDKALKRFNRAATEDDPATQVKTGEALDHIAQTVVAAAIDGDWWAVAEIGNRLDGKPAQSIDFTDHTPDARNLSDAQLLERLERARLAAGAVGAQAGQEDAPELHPIHQRPLDS